MPVFVLQPVPTFFEADRITFRDEGCHTSRMNNDCLTFALPVMPGGRTLLIAEYRETRQLTVQTHLSHTQPMNKNAHGARRWHDSSTKISAAIRRKPLPHHFVEIAFIVYRCALIGLVAPVRT